MVLRADVSDAWMLLKSFPCDAMHKSSACGNPFRCRLQRLFFPFSTTKERTRFSRTKSALFWNKFRVHVLCYPVQYKSFEQLVGVAEQGDRSEALRNGWVLSGLQ